jgi:hypothetical protein
MPDYIGLKAFIEYKNLPGILKKRNFQTGIFCSDNFYIYN